MRTPWVILHLLIGSAVYVVATAYGLTWCRAGSYFWGVLAITVGGFWVVDIYRDVTLLYDRLDEVARTIGDDDAPPGPPRGQE